MASRHFDDDDDDDDRPRRRPRDEDRDDDEDDDRPRRRRDDDYDDDDDRWRRDEEDDYDDRPRGRRRRSEGLAITSMILGIIAIPTTCCCLFISVPLGIAAVIMGFIDRSQNGPNGKSLAGIICGFVAILLSVVSLILNLVFKVGQWNGQGGGAFGN